MAGMRRELEPGAQQGNCLDAGGMPGRVTRKMAAATTRLAGRQEPASSFAGPG